MNGLLMKTIKFFGGSSARLYVNDEHLNALDES